MSEILRVENIKKSYPLKKGFFKTLSYIKALRGISFEVKEGETFGIVGESGSGKSTLAKVILRIEEPDEGKIFFLQKDFLSLKGKELKELRKKMGVVFQDPATSLNPRMKIGAIIKEPFDIHGMGTRKEREELVLELLEMVGLDASLFSKYPHELSGGQKQRVAIARAMALKPKLIILDEAVSALDLSVSAQILNLLKEIQEKTKCAYIFITHSLSVARFMCHRVGIMYSGKFVEIGETEEVFNNSLHPYTKALIASEPSIEEDKKIEPLKGELLFNFNDYGCSFHPRCQIKQDICLKEEPPLRKIKNEHYSACFFS